MYIVLCCARVREIFLSPSQEIHGGHNVSQQSYAVVKIFCPGKIAIPRSKKRSSPKGLVNTISNWRAMILAFFFVFYFFTSSQKSEKYRASVRLFSTTGLIRLPLSHIVFLGDDYCLRLNFSAIRDCRLHWALCTQYTLQWLFPSVSLKIVTIKCSLVLPFIEVESKYRQKTCANNFVILYIYE